MYESAGFLKNLAKKLKKYFRLAGLSETEAAWRIQKNRSYVTRIFNGEISPSITTLYDLCKLCNIPISYLTYTGNPDSPCELCDGLTKEEFEFVKRIIDFLMIQRATKEKLLFVDRDFKLP